MRADLPRRLITALIGVPAALAVVFFLPAGIAFLVYLAAVFWALVEFIRLARRYAPSAPLGSLQVLVPLASFGAFLVFRTADPAGRWYGDPGSGLQGFALQGSGHPGFAPPGLGHPGLWLTAGVLLVVMAAVSATLVAGTEVRDGLAAVAILAFATPYFALPPACLYQLQALDPWLVVLLFAIVWLGDTAAYFVGSWIGRHRMAPVVSPHKTWEGALAGFASGPAAAAVWSLMRLGELRPALLAVAAATAVAAQLGDLVESLVKRGAGVKDSADVLPGHGGFYDRLDAMLLAAPVFTVGVWLLGFGSLVP